jgi:hypothetical protein
MAWPEPVLSGLLIGVTYGRINMMLRDHELSLPWLDPVLSGLLIGVTCGRLTYDAAQPRIVIARLDRAIQPMAGVLPVPGMRRSSRRMTI